MLQREARTTALAGWRTIGRHLIHMKDGGIRNDTTGKGDGPKVFWFQRRKKKTKKRDLMKGNELFL